MNHTSSAIIAVAILLLTPPCRVTGMTNQVGQSWEYAECKAGDADVFLQLLCKWPSEESSQRNYFFYLKRQSLPKYGTGGCYVPRSSIAESTCGAVSGINRSLGITNITSTNLTVSLGYSWVRKGTTGNISDTLVLPYYDVSGISTAKIEYTARWWAPAQPIVPVHDSKNVARLHETAGNAPTRPTAPYPAPP